MKPILPTPTSGPKGDVETATRHLREHPDTGAKALAVQFGLSLYTAKRLRREHTDRVSPTMGAPAAGFGAPVRPGLPSKPLAQLVAAFDEVAKVKNLLAQLGETSYVEDEEMRRTAGIGWDRWRRVVAHPDLARYRYVLPNKRTVWMRPEAQAQLTRTIEMGDCA